MKGKTQLLVFEIDGRRFGLPLGQVKRVIRAVDPTPVPRTPAIVLGVIDLQGTIVPLMNVRGRFGFAPRQVGPDDQFIIGQTPRRIIALLVDRTIGVIEQLPEDIVPTRKILDRVDQIDGVIRLEDGLLLIHDLERFVSPQEELALEHALSSQGENGN